MNEFKNAKKLEDFKIVTNTAFFQNCQLKYFCSNVEKILHS